MFSTELRNKSSTIKDNIRSTKIKITDKKYLKINSKNKI